MGGQYAVLLANPARLISFLSRFKESANDPRLRKKTVDAVLKKLNAAKKSGRRQGVGDLGRLA